MVAQVRARGAGRLLRRAGAARVATRAGTARGLLFVSGDIHVGALQHLLRRARLRGASLTSSGISAIEDQAVMSARSSTRTLPLPPGSTRRCGRSSDDFNFGVVQVVPTGTGAEIIPTLAHEGNADAFGVDLAVLVR